MAEGRVPTFLCKCEWILEEASGYLRLAVYVRERLLSEARRRLGDEREAGDDSSKPPDATSLAEVHRHGRAVDVQRIVDEAEGEVQRRAGVERYGRQACGVTGDLHQLVVSTLGGGGLAPNSVQAGREKQQLVRKGHRERETRLTTAMPKRAAMWRRPLVRQPYSRLS